MDKNLIQRLISGLVYGLIIILCTTPLGQSLLEPLAPKVRQHHLYFGLIAFFLLASIWECIRILKITEGWQRIFALPLSLAVFYLFAKRYFEQGFSFEPNPSESMALFLILVVCLTLFFFKKELSNNSGKLVFTVLYTALPFGFALGLVQFANEQFTWEAFWLFVLIWSSDSFAYFSGKLFGKHKMAPTISPKKTWEGFAGGVLLTLILAYFIESNLPQLQGNWIVVGLLVSIFAPLGDLVESQLKRNFNVKDSGFLIPGHGGVLDRLDSFIICAPVVYIYFLLNQLL